ncbi:hypothetical protein [Burkholderia gladioli]|uniref:Uncharacterized protein n=1 Tax=Burkholderia gladioli (strain BSR3) TaxID=999541 RepID=F2LS38_BURGS|nr:hypothetical protein [Burkholderia gladioli]AEA65697.1 hypothetical protein bgla_2p1050 [Burkholderia gladioli BSR3]
MLEISAILKPLVAALVSLVAGGGLLRWYKDRRQSVGMRMDAARENAMRLEQFAIDLHDLIERNNDARPDGGPFTFGLPLLDDATSTGDSGPDHVLRNRYRDLQGEIPRANRHVQTADGGSWDGYWALDALDRRAYRIGAQALNLAADYRDRAGIRRMPQAPADRDLEQYIHDRACVDAGPPSFVNPLARARYARTRGRLARAGKLR